MKLKKEKALPVIINELQQDIGSGDVTSHILFDNDMKLTACIIAKERCIVAGIDVAGWVFDALDEKIIFKPLCKDGDAIKKGKRVIFLKGSARSIMAGERTALNFLARLSGVATLTGSYVDAVKGTKAKVYDTRKTSPGLRELEKYAVRAGGGCNHRMGLWDGVLIKDNHLDVLRVTCHVSRIAMIKEAVSKAREKGYKNIEIEVDNLKEFEAAVDVGADIIMLDNMKLADIRKAVKLNGSTPNHSLRSGSGHGLKALGSRPVLEASGGVNLENVAGIAKTGVDRISIGSLTHSYPSIDFSLEVCDDAKL